MRVRANGRVSLLCLVLAACGGAGEQVEEQVVADTSTAPPQPAPLSDAQALDVLQALSAAGEEAARDSLELISAPEARRYLNVVRADHQALRAELRVIADSLQLSPEPHEAGDRIRAAAQDARTLLGQQSYGAADTVALEQQVRLHSLFLAALDSAVTRGVRQELLAQYATAVRPTVRAHLLRAEQLERLLREQALARSTARAARPSAAALDTPPRPRPAAIETGRRVRQDTVPRD